jgi:hypothetical protein
MVACSIRWGCTCWACQTLKLIAGISEADALDVLSGFMYFLLIDEPADLCAGHTFHTKPDSARFRLSRTTCTRYEDEDFFFNPYGYWRLCLAT